MTTILNPEAPEFYPQLTVATQEEALRADFWQDSSMNIHGLAPHHHHLSKDVTGYLKVNKTIKSSNQLPRGASRNLFRTFTNFNIVSSQFNNNVVTQSNHILCSELKNTKLKSDDSENNTDKIINANDSLLDRISINIDRVTGVNEPTDNIFIKNNTGVNKPVIAKIQLGSTTFIGAKNIPRPQLTFKDPVDNSDNLWVPKISDKPNNIKPLALNIIYNENDVAIGFEHPYKVELDMYHPPLEFLEADPDAIAFPQPCEQTKLTFIETEQQLDDLVKHLCDVKEMGVDLEHHSYRTYQGITCLLQITTDTGGDFIIDALALREHIHKLNLPFTDPKKIKVFHGAENDVLWLQRDFGVYIVGMFDTHQAAKTLKLNGLSLKYLLMRYCQVETEKKYQLADWRIRPLPDELVEYARSDTHYLLYIWKRMKSDLLEMASGQTHLLLSVFEQSRQIAGNTYSKPVLHEDSHMPLYIRSKKSYNSQQMSALKMLYKWRDSQARELDESTAYLLPNHMLLKLAESLPREVQGVNACCNPMPPFVKQNLITIHRMLLTCRDLPVEPQLYNMPASLNEVLNATQNLSSSFIHKVHDLSQTIHYGDEPVNLDQAVIIIQEARNLNPDIPAFVPTSKLTKIVSDLNVDAKMFIPPYDRYRKYRALAQIEEFKEFKEKEAKIAAIGRGDPLIKAEVLEKLQQAKTQLETENFQITQSTSSTEKTDEKADNKEEKLSRRKRKMAAKLERKESIPAVTETINLTYPENDVSKNKKHENKRQKIRPLKAKEYRDIDYRKFYDESDESHKQANKKFKKRKQV